MSSICKIKSVGEKRKTGLLTDMIIYPKKQACLVIMLL